VHDAIAESAPALRERLSLKWPNDLLADRRKLAGILIEGEGIAVAIGIGINCRNHPDDTAYPATDLATLGVEATPEDVFAALSRTMPARLVQWNRGGGFAAVRRDWLTRCADVGQSIRVCMTGVDREGRFEGLDAAGRLLLRHADGRLETIAAGDVFPGTLSSYPPLKGEGRIAAGDPGRGHARDPHPDSFAVRPPPVRGR
jgi:BirA family biotin operon repressor/biotin-[acetyl-CoA-carboxylase] ligase